MRAIVVGSGISGASAFFALARSGASVVLVDDGAPGQATGASAGIVEPWSSTASGTYYELYTAGAAYYPELLSQLGAAGIDAAATGYRRTGGLIVNRDPSLLDAEQARLEERRSEYGVAMAAMGRVDRIGGERARSLFPPLADGLDALLVEGGAHVDGRRLRDALVSGGERCGGELVRGCAEVLGDTAVAVEGKRIEADVLVIASGAWAPRTLGGLGVPVPVQPQRGQITHLSLDGVDTSGWPTVHPMRHHYLVAFDGGRLAVGATREDGTGFDARVTASGQLQVLEDALSIAPGLANATLIETRVGLRPVADSGVPIVGEVAGRPGLFLATGYGAGGLTMAPLLGDLLARRIAGERVELLDATDPALAIGPTGPEGTGPAR